MRRRDFIRYGSTALATAALTAATGARVAYANLQTASRPLRIAAVGDLHMQAEYTELSSSVTPQMLYCLPIYHAFIEQVVSQQVDAVLLLGDLATSDREKNHAEVLKGLRRFAQANIPVYVLPGNHDLGSIYTRERFKRAYKTHGFSSSFTHDRETLSYAARLNAATWLIMLDTCVLEDGRCLAWGTMPQSTLAWLSDVLDSAAANGARVITASHHPLFLPSSTSSDASYIEQMGVDNADQAGTTLMGGGVYLHLAAHTHHHQLNTRSEDGALLNELVSPMPIMYPHSYTLLTVNQDGTVVSEEQRTDVQAYLERQGTTEGDLADFDSYSRAASLNTSMSSVLLSLADNSLPPEEAAKMTEWWGQITNASYDGPVDADYFESLPGYADWLQDGMDTRYGPWVSRTIDRASTNFWHLDFNLHG